MTRPGGVTTPGSRRPRPTVAVLGAGIAGLTAAHELADRGFEVTVYEPRVDERATSGDLPPGAVPPVKLGGLAASQYSTVGATGGSHAELRPFPGRRGLPSTPPRAVAGEHGFRFFPAYYLHIWDTLTRIPVYEQGPGPDWRATARTVMDNVQRVITQAMIVKGQPSLVFTREEPRTPAELITLVGQFRSIGFTAADVATFGRRILRYLVTSPLRRASELQNLSAYDYFIGKDAQAPRRYDYSPQTESVIRDMPKVLAAFDSRWGDARTNISTLLQLMLRMDRRDDKADGVLRGPTTEVWFDHWHRHLARLGVRFVRGAAERVAPPSVDPRVAPHRRPRVQVELADGTVVAPDYVVAAVDAPAAERITAALRAGTGGVVAGLDGFTTSRPPDTSPLQPAVDRPSARRNPYDMAELGRRPWDRFQTLAGIQYYFDTEFQLVRGHVFYAGTDWGLSSINQHGMWEQRPSLARDGFVAVLSVDIGDFNKPSSHLLDEHGHGKAARDCTPDEIAAEVWRQIAAAVTSKIDNVPEAILPWPAWYALDRNLVMAGPGQGGGRPLRNEAPYLIPIVGDWTNRPGAEPWNPNGTSWTVRTTEDAWRADLAGRQVWQARHGGYQVHHNSLVFAGTWTRTFTRMTTMEAACESARHAVNAILDHYVWVESDGTDRRETTTLEWRMPFGFVDQGLSVPVRMPSPAGDYCFVFDLENREPLETRALRNLDSQYCRADLPHPLDADPFSPPFSTPFSTPPPAGGPPMTDPAPDYTGQLLSYLQAWRQFLETTNAALPSTPGSTGGWPTPAMPTMPGLPTAPQASPTPAVPGSAAAPPGPPVPPVAQAHAPEPAASPPSWSRAGEPVPGGPARSTAPEAGRPAPGPGRPAPFSAAYADPSLASASASPAGREPRAVPFDLVAPPSTAHGTADRAPGMTAPPAANSLFAAPTDAGPERPWWETADFTPVGQEIRGPENLDPGPTAPPPLVRRGLAVSGLEKLPPGFDGTAYVRRFPTPPFGGIGGLNLARSLSPQPVRFRSVGPVEIVGGDPPP